MVKPDRSQMTIRCMLFACWITKATDTHSEYIIVIAFPVQQWLRERVSVLRCTYIGCLFRFLRRVFFKQPPSFGFLDRVVHLVCSDVSVVTHCFHFPCE
jgi:hypothetical protein